MATSKDFAGSNKTLRAPEGLEEIIPSIRVFSSGKETISRWKLSPEEVERVSKTGDIWVAVASGGTQPPMVISGISLMELRDPEGNLLPDYDPDAIDSVVPTPEPKPAAKVTEYRDAYKR